MALRVVAQVINSHMEERPTLSAVKHLVEASEVEVGEKVAGALLPVWEAVRALQAGLKEAGAEAREAGAALHALRQQQVRWCVVRCVRALMRLRGHLAG